MSQNARYLPKATVLAEPAACTHRNTTRSQYASVGTSANPTHDSESTRRQARSIGRLPILSDNVPQNIGAERLSVQHVVGRWNGTLNVHIP